MSICESYPLNFGNFIFKFTVLKISSLCNSRRLYSSLINFENSFFLKVNSWNFSLIWFIDSIWSKSQAGMILYNSFILFDKLSNFLKFSFKSCFMSETSSSLRFTLQENSFDNSSKSNCTSVIRNLLVSFCLIWLFISSVLTILLSSFLELFSISLTSFLTLFASFIYNLIFDIVSKNFFA